MKLKQLFTDDSAVSPVIGVILMVAITVILAAVIGSFVLNLGGSLQQSAPQANFEFDFATGPNADDDNVTITHTTGDGIEADRLTTTGITNNSTVSWAGNGVASGDTVSAGTSVLFEADGDWQGETVRVTWESENGENSATLSQSTAPSS